MINTNNMTYNNFYERISSMLKGYRKIISEYQKLFDYLSDKDAIDEDERYLIQRFECDNSLDYLHNLEEKITIFTSIADDLELALATKNRKAILLYVANMAEFFISFEADSFAFDDFLFD